jgi:hypothetical protein
LRRHRERLWCQAILFSGVGRRVANGGNRHGHFINDEKLVAVDQAGYRVVATKNIFAISERNVVENAFDKYRKKLAGGGINENDCQLIITAAKKAVADLETILRNYPPK